MSGIKFFFDTNALIAFFQGNKNLAQFRFTESTILLSIITVIGFLAYRGFLKEDIELFSKFLKRAEVIDLRYDNTELIDAITSIRKDYKLKLPDAVIAASSKIHKAILVTNDLHFKKVLDLQTLQF